MPNDMSVRDLLRISGMLYSCILVCSGCCIIQATIINIVVFMNKC